MATGSEAKPAEYTPLTRPGHNAETVLEVEGLQTYLFTRLGVVKAVDDVSFVVRRAETLAIVGESGCGKTMTALSLLRLVPNQYCADGQRSRRIGDNACGSTVPR